MVLLNYPAKSLYLSNKKNEWNKFKISASFNDTFGQNFRGILKFYNELTLFIRLKKVKYKIPGLPVSCL